MYLSEGHAILQDDNIRVGFIRAEATYRTSGEDGIASLQS